MKTGLICECNCLVTRHVPMSQGKRGACLNTKCSCMRFCPKPPNHKPIGLLGVVFDHDALLRGADGDAN